MTREHEPLEATLLRLTQERDDADRRYNEALTAVDRALVRTPEFPHPPPPYDDHQITPLNQASDVIAAPPPGGRIKGRLARFVWSVVLPTLQRQAGVNLEVGDHRKRNLTAHPHA